MAVLIYHTSSKLPIKLEMMTSYKVIVNKSTVPGTADKVREEISANSNSFSDVVSNPEFLREGFAVEDSMNPSRVV